MTGHRPIYFAHLVEQRLLVLSVIAICIWFSVRWTRTNPVSFPIDRPPPATVGRRDFFALRLPPWPAGEEWQSLYSRKLSDWLRGLRDAGYRPMLLSDVETRIQRHEFLPPKTIVLFFYPGTQTTFEQVRPLLVRERIPVVWITNGAGVRMGETRYLSEHTLDLMRRSGSWDVGFLDESAPSFVLSTLTPPMKFGIENDVSALNTSAGPRLQLLDPQPYWTAQDLLTRLSVETPLDGPAKLSIASIAGETWGIAVPLESKTSAAFNLKAPANLQKASVAWRQTRGHQDFELKIHIGSRMGRTRFFFRWNEPSNSGTVLSITDEAIRISQVSGSDEKTLMNFENRTPNGFDGVVALIGNTISFRNANVDRKVILPSQPDHKPRILKMVISDDFNGMAEANNVELDWQPRTAAR